MDHLKQISGKILKLVLNILLLTYRTIKQLVLPSKKVKGNVLSSLFVFFIDIVEQLGSFEHAAFSMRAVFKHKYTRQAVLLFSILLCLLSSFERSGETPVVTAGTTSNSIMLQPAFSDTRTITTQYGKIATPRRDTKIKYDPVCTTGLHDPSQLLLTVKQRLLFRGFQI